MAHTQETIEQIKADAEKLTRQRLESDGVNMHQERENEINAMEGVTQGTPVLEAAQVNPSEPGTANFQTLASHDGPKNVHATGEQPPTPSSTQSADQANAKADANKGSKDNK